MMSIQLDEDTLPVYFYNDHKLLVVSYVQLNLQILFLYAGQLASQPAAM